MKIAQLTQYDSHANLCKLVVKIIIINKQKYARSRQSIPYPIIISYQVYWADKKRDPSIH